MTYQFTFKNCLERAERINWRVDELIGPHKGLDFARPFMPEALARTDALTFLSAEERLKLNQIRGHSYLAMFGLVEEFILPFLLDHARPGVSGESYRSRALLEFAAEEAKHIHLFRTFREAFAAGFATRCDFIGPPQEIGAHVLSHRPLAVALLILQIEWMSQKHFTDSVHDEAGLDPRFKDLLLHHWMEEQQHAQMDTLLVQELAAGASAVEIDAAFADYWAMGAFLDDGLKQQTAFELEALERACGRVLGAEERERFLAQQHQASRWTFIGSGLTHPNFMATVSQLKPAAVAEFEAAAEVFA